jgi:threonine synthase
MEFTYDLTAARFDDADRSMWRSRGLLPVPQGVEPVTLGEGGTPLIRTSIDVGCRTWWKDETRNPSGSHKDRALSVSLTMARADGVRDVVVASAGSTALAAATYAARAAIGCTIVVGADAANERLVPMLALGARVLRLTEGSVDDALDLVAEIGREAGLRDVSTRRSGDPWGTEGPKTIAHEIGRDLGAPDWVIVPIGGGGTVAAVWRGFEELRSMGIIDRTPRLLGLQPDTYPTLVTALAQGWTTDDELRANAPTERPPTVQVKTAHTYPPDGAEALAAIRASGGTVLAVSDGDAVAGMRELGARDGLYVEPSSGVVVAAARRLVADGLVTPDGSVVGLACGGGHRETPAVAGVMAAVPIDVAPADLGAVLAAPAPRLSALDGPK